MRIDLALGDGVLAAVVRRGGSDVLGELTVRVPSAGEGRPDLVAALTELRARVDGLVGAETAGALVRVALLPSYADARLLALPPLRASEAAAVVRRDAGRHFLGVPAPRVTAVSVPRRRSGAPVLAVAASAQLVQDVVSAVSRCGWRVDGVAAAHGAWVAAARRQGPDVSVIVAEHAGAAHVIHLADGTPVSMRRLPADAVDELADAVIAGATPEEGAGTDGAVAVLADGDLRDAVAHRLAARGWRVADARQTAAEAAAHHVAASRLALVTDAAAATRRTAQNRLAARLAVAAVVLLVAAAGVELWGAHRELAAVRQQRAAISGQVRPLLELRDSLDAMRDRTGAVEQIAAGAPRWTWALHDLAVMLPADAHITRLQATGDTLLIEGEGAAAGQALQALRSAPSLRDTRLLGVVDRELAGGTTAVERFRMSARLAERRAP
ncbi:MAG TPA: PilN domain-containing protein [Longimicrobiales bacterium]|nr:PilN domain-containing protein [Longimicrobiales bacterium]